MDAYTPKLATMYKYIEANGEEFNIVIFEHPKDPKTWLQFACPVDSLTVDHMLHMWDHANKYIKQV